MRSKQLEQPYSIHLLDDDATEVQGEAPNTFKLPALGCSLDLRTGTVHGPYGCNVGNDTRGNRAKDAKFLKWALGLYGVIYVQRLPFGNDSWVGVSYHNGIFISCRSGLLTLERGDIKIHRDPAHKDAAINELRGRVVLKGKLECRQDALRADQSDDDNITSILMEVLHLTHPSHYGRFTHEVRGYDYSVGVDSACGSVGIEVSSSGIICLSLFAGSGVEEINYTVHEVEEASIMTAKLMQPASEHERLRVMYTVIQRG